MERVNLTTCLGASLTNTLFVLDEPTVGLHARDIQQLVGVMHRLRDKGNTLVVVEHEEAVMVAADEIIDLGPAAGEQGGSLVYQGTAINPKQTTGTIPWLDGRKSIPLPKNAARWGKKNSSSAGRRGIISGSSMWKFR
jgi:excinuclease ABC subunit A